MKQEEKVYIDEDTEEGGEEGEERGIWIEERVREETRMEEEGKGKEKRIWSGGNNRNKIIKCSRVNKSKWIEILEETGDDSIMCLTETQIR